MPSEAYDQAMADFQADSTTPRLVTTPLPGVQIAQSKPAPINTGSTGAYQPEEQAPIDGILSLDDMR